ncbi:MFS general substrate transporter [Aureobasidium pullulans]|uniref:MFS general substrate transporter n=1 Tax=Aureobasidium pullulans TaxID=5580 RepID=A0A4S8ZND1_AURPU|nr:MFS general substrate transporter [Aureobasidium pullulans]THX41590.1 MFS general substrate transporter [Aureobasidium pullulans]THY20940.1 MFS general substrate transporter [Aureobasidium pullulans]THZ31770.1 MFS general substrate transporter [Aureobasidium pullulans]
MSSNTKVAGERAPLLGPQPSTVDAGNEYLPDSEIEDDSGRISVSRAAICVVALGSLIFLQATNISLLTTTQSTIAADLDAFEKTSWFTSAYLIAVSSTSPLTGKLSQLFSPRNCISASAMILGLGALLTSFAQTFASFILGRIITGIGAAGVFTVSIIVVLELSGPTKRGAVIGLLNSGFTVGVAVGATVAGALVNSVGWRALFWMQTPLAVVAGGALYLAIPTQFSAARGNSKESIWKKLSTLDYLGAFTLTVGIVLLLAALSNPRRIPILPIIFSIVALATFILNEMYLAKDPIIPVTLLKSRGMAFTCLGTVGFMMARWSVLFFTPTYTLAVRGWAPAAAGSILIATNGGFALGGILVGVFHIRRQGSFYVACVIVYMLFPITLVGIAMLSTAKASSWLYILLLFLNGLTVGAAMNYTLAHLLHLTPASTHYIATSLIATFRGFAGSFGSAIGGGLFTRLLRKSLEEKFDKGDADLVRRLLGSPAMVSLLKGANKAKAIAGYEDALRGLFLAAAGLAVLMVLVQTATGWKGVEDEPKTQESEEEVVQ